MAVGLTICDPAIHEPSTKNHKKLPGAWLINRDGALYHGGREMGYVNGLPAYTNDVIGISWCARGIRFHRRGRLVCTWGVGGPKEWGGARNDPPARPWGRSPEESLWAIIVVSQTSKLTVIDPFPQGKTK